MTILKDFLTFGQDIQECPQCHGTGKCKGPTGIGTALFCLIVASLLFWSVISFPNGKISAWIILIISSALGMLTLKEAKEQLSNKPKQSPDKPKKSSIKKKESK